MPERSLLPLPEQYTFQICQKHFRVETEDREGGSDHVILPDPVLLPVESLSSYSGGITC